MKKKIYVAGKVYDFATMTVQEIKDDVQNGLDAHYGKGCIVFTLNVYKQTKEVTINFRRHYKDSYNTDDKSIFCYDADLLTGRRINGFQVPVMWPTVPFGYLFSLELDDFITCYKKSAKKLGASRLKDIAITHDKDNLNVRLFFYLVTTLLVIDLLLIKLLLIFVAKSIVLWEINLSYSESLHRVIISPTARARLLVCLQISNTE